MGQAPGTWRCFSPEEVRLITEDNLLSLHQTDLTNGLALAQALDILPDSLIFYGIEPGSTDYGMDLSPAVNHNLPELVDKILADLGNSEA
jgi:hydrogenase maturation protease